MRSRDNQAHNGVKVHTQLLLFDLLRNPATQLYQDFKLKQLEQQEYQEAVEEYEAASAGEQSAKANTG